MWGKERESGEGETGKRSRSPLDPGRGACSGQREPCEQRLQRSQAAGEKEKSKDTERAQEGLRGI